MFLVIGLFVDQCIRFFIRVLPIEHTGHRKHPLPTTQEKTLHIDITQGKKKCKKAKWLSEKALQIAENRREEKSKGEKERYPCECRVPKSSKEREENFPQLSMQRNRVKQ